MGIKTVPHPSHIVQTLLSLTFSYSLSSEAVVMRQLRWYEEGHWHVHTRGLPCSLPEVDGTVQVHCRWRRLLWRRLEFHVCTVIKSANAKIVWKLIVCTLYVWFNRIRCFTVHTTSYNILILEFYQCNPKTLWLHPLYIYIERERERGEMRERERWEERREREKETFTRNVLNFTTAELAYNPEKKSNLKSTTLNFNNTDCTHYMKLKVIYIYIYIYMILKQEPVKCYI